MDDRHGASLYEIEIGIVVPAVIYAPVRLPKNVDSCVTRDLPFD